MKNITKTSAQAKVEKMLSESERTCPECGSITFMGTTISRYVKTGFLKPDRLERTNHYQCGCGCQWNTGWK